MRVARAQFCQRVRLFASRDIEFRGQARSRGKTGSNLTKSLRFSLSHFFWQLYIKVCVCVFALGFFAKVVYLE